MSVDERVVMFQSLSRVEAIAMLKNMDAQLTKAKKEGIILAHRNINGALRRSGLPGVFVPRFGETKP